MIRVRRFENKIKALYLEGSIRGTIHVSQGQEAVAAGGCLALRPDDYILTTHRGHGHCISKGVTSKALMAEIMGRVTGCCQGRAGSLHAFDISAGVLGAAGIVGSGLPQATGVALGIQLLGQDQVVLNYFGDGAANQGAFHEAINMGSVWKLPVIYLCENNQVADTTPYQETINIENVADRAAGYGIPGQVVNGNDVEAVYAAVHQAADRARSGQGPTLIEAKTYRWEGHHIGDPCLWRKDGELEEWQERCPIARLGGKLIAEKILSQADLEEIDQRAEQEMEEAAQFSLESPQPDPETALDYVY
ncbi:MAG: thiamine pyrophosphate-dependent dehydrogenase E1 component subunit alpha [Deltaproteobacteria bacterium]|nr:thiamine pyrophosphate-dependent dehydrogenase E1 component subunit alpha [Deltaproteobacteria bacterium]